MTTAVLRVAGRMVDIDQCLAWLPKDKIEKTWRAGDRRHGDRISVTSGFNLLLAEGDDNDQVLRGALVSLESIATNITELMRGGAESELDLGLMVGGGAPESLRVTTGLLEKLRAFNVDLVVSAYPCSE